MKYSKIVAIDGPSGSGKSTIAKKVADYLGLLYVDTGAMYRALGHFLQSQNIAFEESQALLDSLKNIRFEYGISKDCLIRVNDLDLTEIIREHYVSELASRVSSLKSIREYLVNFQRKLVKEKICVMEGRDIGTVVFPDAFMKIFLTASVEIRAQRRFDQLKEKGKSDLSLAEVLVDVKNRDDRDMNRSESPLLKADDAIELDTSTMSEREVLEKIDNFVKLRAFDLGINL